MTHKDFEVARCEVPKPVADIERRESEESSSTVRDNLVLGLTIALKGGLNLIPGGAFLVEGINAAERRSIERALAVIEEATRHLEGDLAALGKKLADDDELADLWLRGLSSAREAHTKEKLRCFAAILAGAVDADHTQRVVGNVIIRVLDDLEEEHVEVLDAIERATGEQPSRLKDGSEGKPGASSERLRQGLPHLAPITGMLLNSLSSMELIRNNYDQTWAGLQGTQAWILTDLGSRILAMLRSSGTETRIDLTVLLRTSAPSKSDGPASDHLGPR
jgi:hypothetical protein